jgi:hypothetical protein
MIPAPIAIKSKKAVLIITVLTAAALVLPTSIRAAAGAPQICDPGGTCVVGEFLYNDSYVPITGAACTITSKDPDGNAHLTGQVMTGAADGWYAYSFTAPSTEGYYRAQVCCTVGTDYMCLDKSFEVKSSAGVSTSAIASAVWGYSGRTLTSFGDLASNVWSSSSRSLTSFGDLVSNVWSNSSRALTSGGTTTDTSNLATKTDVAQVKNLLEQLVNKPVIENFIEEVPDLGKKLDESKVSASELYVNNEYLVSKSALLTAKWKSLSAEEITDSLEELGTLVGSPGDALADNTIYGRANWVKTAWGFDISKDMATRINNIAASIKRIQMSVDENSVKIAPTKELKYLVAEVKGLEKLIGDISNTKSDATLFGNVKKVVELAGSLNKKEEDLTKVLGSWNVLSLEDKNLKITEARRGVTALNQLPKLSSVLGAKVTANATDKELKNKILSYKGILSSNKVMLAKDAGKPFSNIWIEEGSMVFKTLITNPSNSISQDVPLKYYLPSEVKEENIIEVDDGLAVKYDAERNQYFVEGNFKIAAGSSKTVSVRVSDIWVISKENVEGLRKQGDELAGTLKGTAYYAQGVTIGSDIDVSLDKVLSLQELASTPEEKIRAYREAQIEFNSVQEKIESLKGLAAQGGNASSIFGFVGGSQTLAVWGMIVVIVGGFIWLATSMKMIQVGGTGKKEKESKKGKSDKGSTRTPFIKIALPFGVAIVAVGIASSLITSSLVSNNKKVLGVSEEPTQKTETVIEEPVKEKGAGGEETVRVVVEKGTVVNIRSENKVDAKIVTRFAATKEVTKVGEEGEWTTIVFTNNDSQNSSSEGWVETKYISKETKEEILNNEKQGSVVIKESGTGWLRVRATKGGVEVSKVNTGETFPLIGVEGGWIQIELPDGQTGWVSGQYASVTP